jgi:hypothetical protein
MSGTAAEGNVMEVTLTYCLIGSNMAVLLAFLYEKRNFRLTKRASNRKRAPKRKEEKK